MAFLYADRVQETSNTTGTGTLTLAGASTGYRTFSSAIGNTNTCHYCIVDDAGTAWEVGLGTVGAGTLARTTVLSSTNSNALVNFSSTPLVVFCTIPASPVNGFTGDSGSGGAVGFVPAPSSGDGAAGKVLRADGTWGGPAASTVTGLATIATSASASDLSAGTLPSARFPALTGDVTTSAGSVSTTIANDAVTNAKAANMAQATIKGRASGAGTGDPTDLTGTQATAILDNFVGDSGSGGTKGLVPAPASGDATKFLKGDGTWAAPSGSGDMLKATYDPANIAEQLVGLTATQTLTNKTLTSPVINTDITIPNTGLKLRDTDNSHLLTIAPGSNLTANRTLTITTGDAARTITLSGDTTLSGTNSGDQTITLTGDVTGSGTGSFAATVANDAVTNAKLNNMAASTIKARKTASTGDPEDCTLSEVLDLIGSAAQGDILYRDASSWARLGAGTSGHFLKTQGAAANPTWAAATATADYVDPLALQNVGLSVTVGSSAITIALKQQDGSTDPSTGTAKCNIAFASATATSGATVMRSVTSALSMTVSNGSSLGFASTSATQRVWVGAIDNSGTVELCCWNSLNGTLLSLKRWTDGEIVTTTAEGGSGGADLAWTIYSSTARTSKALRVLGYFEIQAAASYAWTNSPTVVRVMQPGMPMTGDIVQVVGNQASSVATGTTSVPFDNTIPQNGSEGDNYMTQAITPKSSLNILEIFHNGYYAFSTGAGLCVYLAQDSTANALQASGNALGDGTLAGFNLRHRMLAGTTSSTTFKVNAGGGGAGTTTFLGQSGGKIWSTAGQGVLTVTEIFQ